jgi:hypothetical protein
MVRAQNRLFCRANTSEMLNVGDIRHNANSKEMTNSVTNGSTWTYLSQIICWSRLWLRKRDSRLYVGHWWMLCGWFDFWLALLQ